MEVAAKRAADCGSLRISSLSCLIFMYLLYVDMSGNLSDPKQKNFVMAGVAIKESAIYHVIKELDEIIVKSDLKIPPSIELHGVEMIRGRKFWRSVDPKKRIEFFKECLGVFSGLSKNQLKCFGIVLEKGCLVDGEDYGEYAFEQISTRFDRFLRRRNLHRKKRDYNHRGLMVVDESRYEGLFQNLASDYRVNGTKWGKLRNLAEVPLFADSKATRLIQLADLVSYSLWQRYERNDPQYMKVFMSSFDSEAGVYHGLYHRRKNKRPACKCPACYTRGK